MTKNNLKQHLRWLVDRGQPDFAALDVLLTRSDVDTVNAQVSAQPAPDAPRPVHTEQLTITTNENTTPILEKNEDVELKVDGDGDSVLQDANMARLNLIPSSASKPRMLSIAAGNRSDDARPSTPGSDARKNYMSENSRIGDTTFGSAPGTYCSDWINADLLLMVDNSYHSIESQSQETKRAVDEIRAYTFFRLQVPVRRYRVY